jgi:uncharacterized membrane protein YhhN
MNLRLFSTLYFAIGIIFMALETIGATWPAIIAKALIIPVLIMLYLGLIKGQMNGFHRMILSALVFSWLGDVILQLQDRNDMFFMIGLSCFLIAQIMYLVAFFSTKGENVLFFKKIYLIISVILYGVILLFILYNHLGDMKVPVIIYAVVILTMVTAALNRQNKVNRQSYILVLIGAIFFVLSDSILAINKFSNPFMLSRVTNMTTYILAQYLIALGCLKQFGIEFKWKN